MSAIKNEPQGGQDRAVEVHHGEVAYLVHLIRTDATVDWNPRRRLRLDEALSLADRLEACLPTETRRRLARLHRTKAA